MSENRCLVLFTKPSVAGRVKTRLLGVLTPEAAADLHGAFLGDIIDRMAKGSFSFQIAWGVEVDEELPTSYLDGFRQANGDLGQRLFHGLQQAGREHEFVAAVGSDHPGVSAERISEAFAALAAPEQPADIVIGPASDGGYYAIAAKATALSEELFADIPWSSSGVLSATLRRCAELQLRVHLLPQESDVDTPADLERLCDELLQGNFVCPRTYSLLSRWGRLPAS